jgi:hypothetical protein
MSAVPPKADMFSVEIDFKPNNGALGADSATVAVGSPFNMVNGGSKVYAGAMGSPSVGSNSPHTNSQYDNACAQAQLH